MVKTHKAYTTIGLKQSYSENEGFLLEWGDPMDISLSPWELGRGDDELRE